MATKTLFQPAGATARYLKVLLHGTYGTGKTCAALSFPGPLAVIDLEGGTALYAGFDVVRTKDLRTIEAAIEAAGTGAYRTLVIDPLTVLWQLLQDAGQGLVDRRKGDSLESGQALSPREWGLIKRRYASILTRLNNLPLHVVLIARDTDLYEGTGDQLKRVGIKPDVEKSTPYVADLVLHLQTTGGKITATVDKSRSPLLPLGQVLTGFTADPARGLYPMHLAKLAAASSTGAPGPLLEEDRTVVAGNSAALEPARDEPPLERYYERIETHFRRLRIDAAGRETLLAALTDGAARTLPDIADRERLTAIGQTLAGWKTDDDLNRFWAQHDAARQRAPEEVPA